MVEVSYSKVLSKSLLFDIKMSVYVLIAGGAIAGAGAICAGVSTAITGIQSTRLPEEQESDRQMLLASAALVGFGTIFLIIGLVVLFLYLAAKKRGVKKKGLIITWWVMFGLFAACALTGGVLAGVVGNKEENAGIRGAMITAAILPAIGLVLLIIGFFILRAALKGKV